jgi:transposase InsO family protein/transposase-like protein
MPEHPTVWRTANSIDHLFMAAYMVARARTLEHASRTVRLLGQRDHLFTETALLEREVAILRSHRCRRPPKQRPHYTPEERAQILSLMALRHWSPKKTAERFGLHPNTVRNWLDAIDGDREGRIGAPPWNKLHQSVRWLVKEIRTLCPEPEFGSRTIVRHIVRAGVAISRSSVRRILQEETANRPTPTRRERVTEAPNHLQHPMQPHQVWHLDLTELRVLWMRFEIAVIIDGFTRKIIAERIFNRRPTTDDLASLLRKVTEASRPRFLITDHGSQFRSRFRRAVHGLGIEHIRCSVGHWQLNAKLERVNRTLKDWAHGAMLIPSTKAVQNRIDSFTEWFNEHRPHAAHGIRTPVEAEAGSRLITPVHYAQRGTIEPCIRVTRTHHRGDPRLVITCIVVEERRFDAA